MKIRVQENVMLVAIMKGEEEVIKLSLPYVIDSTFAPFNTPNNAPAVIETILEPAGPFIPFNNVQSNASHTTTNTTTDIPTNNNTTDIPTSNNTADTKFNTNDSINITDTTFNNITTDNTTTNIDFDNFDIFDIQDEHISSIQYITPGEIVDETTNHIFSRKYPIDPIYKKEPAFVPSLNFTDTDTGDISHKVIHFHTKNYEITANDREYMRIRNIMKDEAKHADPFITWNFFKEDSYISQFGGLFFDDLCLDAKKIHVEPNAGGNSENSESLSMDMLHQLYGGNNVRTEMNIEYFDPNWKKCDFLCSIFDQNWGVSVTRAMSFPDPNGFTKEEAKILLVRKLQGLIVAKQGILINDNFLRSILHIWCETDRTAGLLIDAYSELSDESRDNVGVVLTIIKKPDFPFVPIEFDDDIKKKIDELAKLSPSEINYLIHNNHHISDSSSESTNDGGTNDGDTNNGDDMICVSIDSCEREELKRVLSIKRYVEKYNSLSTSSRNIFYNYGPKNHALRSI